MGARRANKSNCCKVDCFGRLLSSDFKSSSIFFLGFDFLIIGLGGGNCLALGLGADLFGFLAISFSLGTTFFVGDDAGFAFGDNSIRSNLNVGTTICS